MNYKEITKNTYNEKADSISARFGVYFPLYAQHLADKFVDLCPTGDSGFILLDIGCGSGDAAAYFKGKPQIGNVVGIDISSEMLKHASNKGVDVIQMDIENLAFTAGNFDAIWAMNSLLHLPKKRLPAVLCEIANLLKDDGVAFISIKKGEGEKFLPSPEGNKYQRYYSFWQEEEFSHHLNKHFSLVDSSESSRENSHHLNFFLRKNDL